MSNYIADWDGRIIHRPAHPKRNPRLVIDTNGDHVERIAWLHGVTVEAGIGLGALPCFVADGRPELVRLAPPDPAFASSLWLLTHPHLRHAPRVRDFMDFLAAEIAPYAGDWWNKAEFPAHILPKLAALELSTPAERGYSHLFAGLVIAEMTRVNTPIASSADCMASAFITVASIPM